MDYSDITKEMFNIFKSNAESTFGTISMLQNQNERMVSMLLEQSNNLQAEGRKYLEEWINATRKNQEELRKTYSNGMEVIVGLFQNEVGDRKKSNK